MSEKTIPIIEIHDRLVRSSDENTDDLRDSIKDNGLIHPITVDQNNNIISGKRRYLAAKALGWSEIPCIVRSVEDPKVYRLHENLKRHNLSWFEQADMIRTLHELRQKQHGESVDGKKIGWGLRDTAKELSIALGATSEYIQLAKAVENDPGLRNIKDKRTALRVTKMTAKRIHQEEEGAFIPEDVDYDQILCGESTYILKQYPKESFHACITDPPWKKFGKAEREGLIRDENTFNVFKQVYRVLNKSSFLYLFCGLPDFQDYAAFLPKLGFTVSEVPLIWHKTKFLSRAGVASWGYHRDYEFVLYAVKGSPALLETIRTSVFTYPIVPPVKMIHQNEKPVDLIKGFLHHCTTPGGLVLDPFGGSCVLAEAAIITGRRYVCIEMDGDAANKGEMRLKRVKKGK